MAATTDFRQTREFASIVEGMLEDRPWLEDLFPRPPRDPRWAYWQTPDGAMFIYTTERMGDGKYASAIYRPTGKGSRSGKAKVTNWKVTREVHHSTRKAAKARAYRLYEQARS